MEQPNLNYIRQLSQGDADFENQLIAVIRKEFPLEVEDYQKHMNARNFKKAAAMVHKIKHKISIFGMEESHAIASLFENNLNEQNDKLRPKFEAILMTITQFLKTI